MFDIVAINGATFFYSSIIWTVKLAMLYVFYSYNLTVLLLGTIMTKISSWKQLAIITSTDWSVSFKAF